MTTTKLPFKIYSNWESSMSFDDMMADCRFIYSHKKLLTPSGNHRIFLVLKHPVDSSGCDTFEISYYGEDGIFPDGVSKFNDFQGEYIQDSSLSPVEFIADFLKKEASNNIITPLIHNT